MAKNIHGVELPDERISIKPNQARTLRGVVSGDMITLEDKNGDAFVVTKAETQDIVCGYIKREFRKLESDLLNEEYKKLEGTVLEHMKEIEKSIDAFIEYKFDKLAEKVCEMLLARNFKEEIDRKIQEKLNKPKGRF